MSTLNNIFSLVSVHAHPLRVWVQHSLSAYKPGTSGETPGAKAEANTPDELSVLNSWKTLLEKNLATDQNFQHHNPSRPISSLVVSC